MGETKRDSSELTLAIIGLILQYGVPAAISIYNTWAPGNKERPTPEEIEALKALPPPDSFFKTT